MEPSDDAPGVLIGHGHHFDTASTPLYAPEIGEMLSECLGWAYEGADRVWRWGNGDGVEEWAGGGEAFNNTLVTDEPDPYQLSGDTVAALTDALEALFLPPSPGTRSRPRSSRSYPPCWSSSETPACSRTCSTATSPGSTSAARIPGKRCSTRSSVETGGSSSATSTRSSSTSSSTPPARARSGPTRRTCCSGIRTSRGTARGTRRPHAVGPLSQLRLGRALPESHLVHGDHRRRPADRRLAPSRRPGIRGDGRAAHVHARTRRRRRERSRRPTRTSRCPLSRRPRRSAGRGCRLSCT